MDGRMRFFVLLLLLDLLMMDREGCLYFFIGEECFSFFLLMFVFNGGICNIDIYLLVILLIFLEFII